MRLHMISVIIPTLDAAPYLARAFAPLISGVAEGIIKEAIVVDGGSRDDSIAIAEAAGATIVASQAGRARQLIAGAAKARGEWLLFLHADSTLAQGWLEETRRFIERPGAEARAAAFRFAFDDDAPAARRVQFWARARAALFKLPYGDQGLLISRKLYDELGGYRDLALMEDVDIVRRIGARRLVLFEAEAVTSADKYRRDGYQKRAWRNLGLLARYLLGADPAKLARDYD
jgi:rSAM/selenodomain-associated transferase 2